MTKKVIKDHDRMVTIHKSGAISLRLDKFLASDTFKEQLELTKRDRLRHEAEQAEKAKNKP